MNSVIDKKRIVYLDVLKCIAIYLVVWGHCIQFMSPVTYINDSMTRFLYSFHMPLFMMISGFFAWHSMQLSFGRMVLKKVRELILPNVMWAIVISLLSLVSTFLIWDYNGYANPNLISRFNFFFWSDLWFLKTLFICYILASTWINLRKHKIIGLIITLLLSHAISSINLLSLMYPCFLVGMGLKYYSNYFTHKKDVAIIIISFIVFILLYIAQTFILEYKPFSVSHLIGSGLYKMAIYTECYRIIELLLGISGSFVFIFFIKLICRYFHEIKCLSNIGRFTLGIYIWQTLFIQRFIGPFLHLPIQNHYLYDFILTPVAAVIITIICALMTKLESKSRILATLFLGK